MTYNCRSSDLEIRKICKSSRRVFVKSLEKACREYGEPLRSFMDEYSPAPFRLETRNAQGTNRYGVDLDLSMARYV